VSLIVPPWARLLRQCTGELGEDLVDQDVAHAGNAVQGPADFNTAP
jgi:hypothetical protein